MEYMNQKVLELFPDYKRNPYLQLEAFAVTRELIELVPMKLTSSEIEILRKKFKKGIK